MNTINLYNTSSYRCSQAVTSTYSTSFSFAIRLLHTDMQDAIAGIYGFVRLADEIVDTFHDYDKQLLLDKFRAETYTAIAQGISLNPVLQSFQLVVNNYRVRHDLIDAFFSSMETDLHKKSWKTKAELDAYIYGSAEVVGLMCLQVFCEGDEERVTQLTPAATALGAAFQKVNFLRDLKDDAENLDRQYFPGVDFEKFDNRSKLIIEKEIQADFDDAYTGIVQLPVKARLAVLVAYRYYFCLFRKIKRMSPDAVRNKRIRVPNAQKMLLMLQTATWDKMVYSLK